MNECKVFISYSHADEWLKEEFIKHLAALQRNGVISVWHDRQIPAGGILDEEIDCRLHDSNLFLMLISNDFIHSEYCYRVEYKAMLARYDRGDVTIVPIIVRDCDWDVDRLKSFVALPQDAIPVTRNAGSKTDVQQRDAAWVNIIQGLKPVIEKLKKQLEPPHLLRDYLDELFLTEHVKHQALTIYNERLLYVDPDVFYENKNEQISSFNRVLEICLSEKAVIFIGSDRSGKTLQSKILQAELDGKGYPTVILKGNSIQNSDIKVAMKSALRSQYGVEYPLSRLTVIIDDFDECRLRDSIKERIVEYICKETTKCIIFSFSNAPSVLFTSADLPDPATININPINDSKAYLIVKKWKELGSPDGVVEDRILLRAFERIQHLVGQAELDQYPSTIITFLQLLDTTDGSDLAFSSYAACYDTMVSVRLASAGVQWTSIDEAKNFLALLAYTCYSCDEYGDMAEGRLTECIDLFEEQFLSSGDNLRQSAMLFMSYKDGIYRFREEYLWFFLCARYVVTVLSQNDKNKYGEFVKTCTENIFLRKYANLTIYIAYFSRESDVLLALLDMLDRLFSKADNWVLSDDSRDIVQGITSRERLRITANSDISQNRITILETKIADIINNAESVVASYTLPFLRTTIGDSEYIDNIDPVKIDADSYMRSVNALLRIHSVIGQILGSRSGTYKSSLMLNCIERMVKASGRYVYLNHAIATVLIFNREAAIEALSGLGDKDYYEKVVRIFSFWSVYLSHAGLARYLTNEHSIRALEKLSEKYDTDLSKTGRGNIPFNYTAVLIIGRLYQSSTIDRVEIEKALKKYGRHSSIIQLFRAAIYIYSYYMPLEIEDKQWLSSKLNIPLERLEVVGMKKAICFHESAKRKGSAEDPS